MRIDPNDFTLDALERVTLVRALEVMVSNEKHRQNLMQTRKYIEASEDREARATDLITKLNK